MRRPHVNDFIHKNGNEIAKLGIRQTELSAFMGNNKV
jgi:hypothetical protein